MKGIITDQKSNNMTLKFLLTVLVTLCLIVVVANYVDSRKRTNMEAKFIIEARELMKKQKLILEKNAAREELFNKVLMMGLSRQDIDRIVATAEVTGIYGKYQEKQQNKQGELDSVSDPETINEEGKGILKNEELKK